MSKENVEAALALLERSRDVALVKPRGSRELVECAGLAAQNRLEPGLAVRPKTQDTRHKTQDKRRSTIATHPLGLFQSFLPSFYLIMILP